MTDYKLVSTPLDAHFKLSSDFCPTSEVTKCPTCHILV